MTLIGLSNKWFLTGTVEGGGVEVFLVVSKAGDGNALSPALLLLPGFERGCVGVMFGITAVIL